MTMTDEQTTAPAEEVDVASVTPTAQAGQDPRAATAALVARVEALEAALAELAGPDGCLVTGSVVVVDKDSRPVVVLSPRSRQIEVLDKGKAAAWIQVDAGHSSLHLQHLTAEALLNVRGGVSQGNTASNGSKLHLSDGGASAEFHAEHRPAYTGAGYGSYGTADLHLTGADVGGRPGARVAAVAASAWADVHVVSRQDDDDRTSRLSVHVEQESLADPEYYEGQVDIDRWVPAPPAWAR